MFLIGEFFFDDDFTHQVTSSRPVSSEIGGKPQRK